MKRYSSNSENRREEWISKDRISSEKLEEIGLRERELLARESRYLLVTESLIVDLYSAAISSGMLGVILPLLFHISRKAGKEKFLAYKKDLERYKERVPETELGISDVWREVISLLEVEGIAKEINVIPAESSIHVYIPPFMERIEVIDSIDARIERELEKRGITLPEDIRKSCFIARGYLSGVISGLLGKDYILVERRHREKVKRNGEILERCIYSLY